MQKHAAAPEDDEDAIPLDLLLPEMAIGSDNREDPEGAAKEKIMGVVGLFDHERDNAIDERDVGMVLRYLVGCLSEADVEKIKQQMMVTDSDERIPMSAFLPRALRLLHENHGTRPTEQQVVAALQVIASFRQEATDGVKTPPEDIKEVPTSQLVQLLTSLGEPLTTLEVDHFLHTVAGFSKTAETVVIKNVVKALLKFSKQQH